MPESTLTQSFCVPIRELGLRPSAYWVGLDGPRRENLSVLLPDFIVSENKFHILKPSPTNYS